MRLPGRGTWPGLITIINKHNVHCDNTLINSSRVEELLAGGDADVEDLDADGQSFIYCFLLFLIPCHEIHEYPSDKYQYIIKVPPQSFLQP